MTDLQPSERQSEASGFTHDGFFVVRQAEFRLADDAQFMIAIYSAVKDTTGYGFAFAVRNVDLAVRGAQFSADMFEALAREAITQMLDDSNMLVNRREYTFDYDFNSDHFVESTNPVWWIKTSLA